MNVRDILFKVYPNLIEVDLPKWLDKEVKDNNSIIKSYVWKTDELRRIRLCELNIRDKFIAESLVMYPDFQYINPVFGTEYVSCANKKFFGTIDFHPLKMDSDYENQYIKKYLGDQPNRIKEDSKIYDLNTYFSKKLWLKTNDHDFYEEYLDKLELYLNRYNDCTKKCEMEPSHIYQKGYDYHLSYTDPAYGILKSYYDKSFARKYINEFLFDLA
jgi:hypothetical protein